MTNERNKYREEERQTERIHEIDKNWKNEIMEETTKEQGNNECNKYEHIKTNRKHKNERNTEITTEK